MSPAAVALQFPALDSGDAEWGEEREEVATVTAAEEKARRLEALKKGLRIGQPDGSPLGLDALKAEVALVVAGGRGAGPAWPTGVAELDAALGGGVPRGRVTEVVGPLGAGKTSLVRQLVARVLAEGGWVAWVDATRTLAP
ncbi:MAG: ATPase domain-containing protein, partial [Gemmatimonas sp.]